MLRKRILSIIGDYIRSNYQLIKVKPGACRFNYHCHSNSVHEAVINHDKEIALVVYFEGNEPCVHFINVYDDETFVDNTLGVWAERMDMYLIRKISDKEFFGVYNIHRSYRMHLKRLLPFWLQLFHDHKSV